MKANLHSSKLFYSYEDERIIFGFSTRHGGFSKEPYARLNVAEHVGDDPFAVLKNRELLAKKLGFNEQAITWASQVHGDTIVNVNQLSESGYAGEADAFVTQIPGIPLFAFFADCIPVILFDSKRQKAGIVHAGWKGTWLQIASKTAQKMCNLYNLNPSDLQAVIGPGICRDHYQISSDMYDSFLAKDAIYMEALQNNHGSFYADLGKINQLQLLQAGIGQIFNTNICPFCQNEDFFSYRKEHGKTGRFATFIMLKDDEGSDESQ